MNRRIFMKMCLLSSSAYLALFFKFKSKPVKVTYQCIPKTKQKLSYHSPNDFFYKFYGKEAWLFNKEHFKEGKILNTKNWLSDDKTTVKTEYVYRDMQALMDCDKSWLKKYSKDKDPVNYIIVDIA